MQELSLSHRPQLIRNCRLSEPSGQPTMLLMPDGVLKLKGTGVDIVRLCDGSRTLQEILSELQRKYPQVESNQMKTEVIQFLQALIEKRAIDCT